MGSNETWTKLSDPDKHNDVVTRWVSASDFNEYVLDENTLSISHVAISFTKQMGIFIEGTCKLLDAETTRVIRKYLKDLFSGVKDQFKSAITCCESGSESKQNAQKSYEFVKT